MTAKIRVGAEKVIEILRKFDGVERRGGFAMSPGEAIFEALLHNKTKWATSLLIIAEAAQNHGDGYVELEESDVKQLFPPQPGER